MKLIEKKKKGMTVSSVIRDLTVRVKYYETKTWPVKPYKQEITLIPPDQLLMNEAPQIEMMRVSKRLYQ